MFKDKMGMTGNVGWVVRDKDGNIKPYERNIFQRFLGLWSFTERLFNVPEFMDWKNHNIVTDIGDALVADILQETPERTKLDNANAVIGVGTGYVSEVKTVTALVTQTGSDEEMDATYPVTKGAWAAADDNVIVYKATFEAADLNDTGIDEAILDNGTDALAYAQITPAVDVSTADTLEVTWEITVLGA